MKGGKIKNIKKQTLLEFLAVIILAIATIFVFVNNSQTVYGYTETNEDRCGYFPGKGGYCFLSLTAPNNGGNYCTIQVNFDGPTGLGKERWDFAKETHEVTLSRTKIWGNTAFEGTLVDTKVDTTHNAGDGFTIVKFRVKWKLPAHYTWVGFETNPIFDRPAGNNPRFNCTDDGIVHHTTDSTFIATYEINLSNTGLISPEHKEMRRVGCAARIKVYRPTYKYTLNDSLNGNKSESCTCGTEKYLPNNSYSGYDFLGWKGTNDVTYSAGTKTVLCDNRTFTAQWKAQSHYVTFDTQGGTFPSSLKSQTELDGCKIIPNGIYSIKSNCGSNMYMHVYGASYNKTPDNATAICIYGGKGGSQTQWVIERYKNTQYYTITSYHNGLALSLAGSPTNNSPGTGQRGKQLELWSMEKDIIDYQWYFKENNGHLEIYNRSTNQCLDVYAAGTTDATPIQQYNPNHSYAQWWDFEPVVQTDYPTKLQYANYNLLTPSISPQRGVDNFLGWSTDKNATSPTYKANSVCNIYGNSKVTLYAIYQAKATVSYDANGGSNASLPKPKTVNVGDKITLASAGSMGRDNYVFLGWSTDPHATKNYNAADSEVTISSSGNVVYYAIWKNATGNADLSNVITGDGMFTNDTELEGQNGTTYNSIHDGLDYAKPDGGVDEPGYYIEK